MTDAPELTLSHFEIRVADVAAMEAFYTRALGFVVTDRGAGADGLIFLSRSPAEHHQIVLNPGGAGAGLPGRLDHLAFRLGTLAELRRAHDRLVAGSDAAVETVSHGTTWSLYFTDPEGNRLEIFTDTPWHVDQPARFPVDLGLDDAALMRATEDKIKDLPGFRPSADWRLDHSRDMTAGR